MGNLVFMGLLGRIIILNIIQNYPLKCTLEDNCTLLRVDIVPLLRSRLQAITAGFSKYNIEIIIAY
jgi:hypothetical protein